MPPYGPTNTIMYPSSIGVFRKMKKGLSTAASLQPNAIKSVSRSSLHKPSSVYKQGSLQGKRMHVVFSHVSVRLYERTLGDNPCCYGAPLTLGWEYTQKKPDYIEDYENLRKTQRRPRKELSIPFEHRKSILHNVGVSDEDITKREAELVGIRNQMLFDRSNYGGFKNRMKGNVSPVKQTPTYSRQNTPPMSQNTQLTRKNAPIIKQKNVSSIRQVPSIRHNMQPLVRPVTQPYKFLPKEQEMEC